MVRARSPTRLKRTIVRESVSGSETKFSTIWLMC